MNEELKELHDLYGKHNPEWQVTLIGPTAPNGKKIICAIGVCACRDGVYTSLTKYKPEKGEEVDGPWNWEKAPLEEVITINDDWRKPFENALKSNPALKEAEYKYRKSREHINPKAPSYR